MPCGKRSGILHELKSGSINLLECVGGLRKALGVLTGVETDFFKYQYGYPSICRGKEDIEKSTVRRKVKWEELKNGSRVDKKVI